MTGSTRISLLVATVAAAACAPQSEPPQHDLAADLAAVNAVREQEVAAMAAGESSATYFAADAVMMPPNEPAVRGLDAIDAWSAAMGTQVGVAIEYTESEITVAGDWAIERYAAAVTLTPVDGGDPVDDVVKGLHVYRREADGSWKMVYDMWNSDEPAAEM